MAYCRLVFSLLVLSVVQCFASSQVPVFIWGDLSKTHSKSNPLAEVSGATFSNIVEESLSKRPFTVVFMEETLSVEDFSIRNSDGETSYPYLHANIGDSLYLPSVESPLRVLKLEANSDNVITLTDSGLSGTIKPENGKFVFINLRDAREGESRSSMLRRHNDFIQKTIVKLQEQYGSVAGLYTAHNPSWTITEHKRVRREVITRNGSLEYRFDNLLMKVGNMTLNINGTLSHLETLTSQQAELNGTEYNQTLTFDNTTITLNFYSNRGYWFFQSVTLSKEGLLEELQPKVEVYALNNFCYRCGQDIIFTAFNQSIPANLTIHNLKIQPYFSNTSVSANNTFGDSFHCVGFFSVPIWSGLFVVFILLIITFYGIMMMLDIRTNDRFDDPKGKTITINASE